MNQPTLFSRVAGPRVGWTTSRWMRGLIVLAVIGFSALIGLRQATQYLPYAILGIAGVAVSLLFMRSPQLGILSAMLSSVLIPYIGPSGLNATFVLVALLLGMLILEMIISRGSYEPVRTRPLWPALAFVLTALVSLGVGQLRWYNFVRHAPLGAQVAGMAIYVLSMAAFILFFSRIQDLTWLKRIVWIFLPVAALILLLKSTPALSKLTSGVVSTPGAVFWVWVAAIAFSQALMNRELRPALRVVLFGLTLLAAYHMYFQRFDQKSGWVTIFICLAGVLGTRSLKLSFAMLLLVLAGVMGLNLVGRTLTTEAYSLSTRIEAGQILAEMIKVNPVLGLGFSNYYWYAPLFPIRGFEVSFNSHNNYIDIAAQVGLLGLLFYTWFLAEIFALILRLRDRVPRGGFAYAFLYGSAGAFAGMVAAGMLGDWVMPFFYNIGVHGFRHSVVGWFLLGGLVVLEQVYPDTSQSHPGQPVLDRLD